MSTEHLGGSANRLEMVSGALPMRPTQRASGPRSPSSNLGLTAWLLSHPQFIVAEDGSCGMVYEHAAAEGPPIVALVDHVMEYT